MEHGVRELRNHLRIHNQASIVARSSVVAIQLRLPICHWFSRVQRLVHIAQGLSEQPNDADQKHQTSHDANGYAFDTALFRKGVGPEY